MHILSSSFSLLTHEGRAGKHRPEIPLSNEEVTNWKEKDTGSNQETDKIN